MAEGSSSEVVSRTFRFRKQVADRLAVEAIERRVRGEKPDNQQAIIQEALGLWLNMFAVSEHSPIPDERKK
jgi:hypothetical protein